MRVATLLVLSAIFAVACGDDSEPGDASADSAPSSDAGVAAPPQIEWLDDSQPTIAPPVLTPCPEGWREVTDDDGVYCVPYAAGGPESCPDGEAHFLGEEGCRPVGESCPTGDFAAGLPTDASVIYVREGPTGGDGTLASPYGSLSDVPWLSLGGRTLALAKGTYGGTLPLRPGVRVVGACAAETILVGASVPVAAVVTVTSGGDPAELRDITILDPPQMGVVVDGSGRTLVISGVVVDGAVETAVRIQDSASLIADGLVVRNTREGGPRDNGIGLVIRDAAEASVERAIIEGGFSAGIAVEQSATATLRDFVVRGVAPLRPSGDFGVGLSVSLDASATVERALIEDTHTAAIFLNASSPSLDLRDVVLRGTRPRPFDDSQGAGIMAEAGTVTARRVLIETSTDFGVLALGGAITLDDVVVRDTRGRPGGLGQGFGVWAHAGGAVTITRALLARNRDIGAVAAGAGTSLTLSDTVIVDMLQRDEETPSMGRGVVVGQGAHGALSRVLVDGAFGTGVQVHGAESVLELEDVAVRDVLVDEGDVGKNGAGVTALAGAELIGSRILVRRAATDGIFVAGSSATLSDVVIEENTAGPEQLVAVGLWATDGATVGLARARITDVDYAAVSALNRSVVTLDDFSVRRVDQRLCTLPICAENPGGHGIMSVFGSMVTVDAFEVHEAALCGLFVAEGGAIDATDGDVAGCTIGACVQVDDYDVSRLMRGVRFVENDTALQSTMLPVPEGRETVDP